MENIESKKVGLLNPKGVSCYLNSSMQILMRLGVLTRYLENSPDKTSTVYPAIKEFVDKWRGLPEGDAFLPTSILDLNLLEETEKPSQQDPSDFLSKILLHLGISFDVLTETTRTCNVCQRESFDREQEGLELSLLESDQPVTMEMLIDFHSNAEIVENVECQKCGNKTSQKVCRQFLGEAPSFLRIALKRFIWGFRQRTRSRRAAVPEGIEVSTEVQIKSKLRLLVNNKQTCYKLVGCIARQGDKSICGHNFSLVQMSDEIWYELNDKKITELFSWEALKQASQSGVIFFYKLVNLTN